MNSVIRCVLLLSALLAGGVTLSAQDVTSPATMQVAPVVARDGMVVAQETRATRIGADVLRRGGNAIDAAVATGFALAVTYPRAGNIGGGGYMLIHLADGRDIAIDYRETAPAAMTRDIFLDRKRQCRPAKSRDSALAVGVPGTVAGLALAHAKYGSGKFTLADLMAPAIELARNGIPVEDDIADSLPSVQARMARWPASAKIFLKPDGQAAGAGRHAGAERSRRHAVGDRAQRSPRVLRGPDGRAHRRRVAGGRRHHDGGRSASLPADRARAGARQLPRLRRRLDAAIVVGRRDPDRDAEHPRRL